MEHFPLIEANPGVSLQVALIFKDKTLYDFFKIFITGDTVTYIVDELISMLVRL
jgi:hypothetical protein